MMDAGERPGHPRIHCAAGSHPSARTCRSCCNTTPGRQVCPASTGSLVITSHQKVPVIVEEVRLFSASSDYPAISRNIARRGGSSGWQSDHFRRHGIERNWNDRVTEIRKNEKYSDSCREISHGRFDRNGETIGFLASLVFRGKNTNS